MLAWRWIQCLSNEKPTSMGLRSDEYGGKKKSSAPVPCTRAWSSPYIWILALSMITIDCDSGYGFRNSKMHDLNREWNFARANVSSTFPHAKKPFTSITASTETRFQQENGRSTWEGVFRADQPYFQKTDLHATYTQNKRTFSACMTIPPCIFSWLTFRLLTFHQRVLADQVRCRTEAIDLRILSFRVDLSLSLASSELCETTQGRVARRDKSLHRRRSRSGP